MTHHIPKENLSPRSAKLRELMADHKEDIEIAGIIADIQLRAFEEAKKPDPTVFVDEKAIAAIKDREQRIRAELVADLARAVGLLEGLKQPDEYLTKRYNYHMKRLKGRKDGEG